MAMSGPSSDRAVFGEFIEKNVTLDSLRTGLPQSTHATANYVRGELATAIRKGPYEVNMLLAGYDASCGASMYYIVSLPPLHPLHPCAVAAESLPNVRPSPSPRSPLPGPARPPARPPTAQDYMGAMTKVNYGAHGYCGYFAYATMDRYWHDGFTLAEAKDLLRTCISNLKTRFVMNQPNFIVKLVDKSGVQVIEL